MQFPVFYEAFRLITLRKHAVIATFTHSLSTATKQSQTMRRTGLEFATVLPLIPFATDDRATGEQEQVSIERGVEKINVSLASQAEGMHACVHTECCDFVSLVYLSGFQNSSSCFSLCVAVVCNRVWIG